MEDDLDYEGFEWDQGNKEKNWVKHQVNIPECEQVFLNNPVVLPDTAHSQKEQRYYALGRSDRGRLLFVSFTIRRTHIIRVISARDMSRKEELIYGNFKENS